MVTHLDADISENIANFIARYKNDDETPSTEEVINLFENQNTQKYFKFNIRQYCELLSSVLNNTNNAQDFRDILKQDNIFHKTLIDAEEFCGDFIEFLLLPLIKTSSKIPEVFEEASRTLQECVFSKHLHEFNCFLRRLFQERTCDEKHAVCKNLFKFFSKLYATDYSSYGFQLIFHSYSKSYKNFIVAYELLVVVTQMIGFEITNEFDLDKIQYQIESLSLSASLRILNGVLNAISKLKIESECKLNHVSFTDFLKNLLQSVMSLSGRPNAVTYRILLISFEINPLIVESLIDEIIIYAMLNDNSELRREYEELFIKVLEVFNKLHRIQNLISTMVPTLKSGIEDRKLNAAEYTFTGDLDVKLPLNCAYVVEDIFPNSVSNYFTRCVIHLASWQVINLFKTLLFHLSKAVQELGRAAAENIHIEMLSVLLCWVLQSVRMAEHTVASATVSKFVAGLEELRVILAALGKILLRKEHDHTLMKSFLQVSFYWGEIYITLEYYSVSNAIAKRADNNFSACNITYLHSYLNDEEWCLISQRIHNFGGKDCQRIMQQLMIQKWRAFVTFEGDCDDVTDPIVRELASSFAEDSLEVYTDRFVVNAVLRRLPSSVVIDLAECIVKQIIDGRTEIQPHICESEIIRTAVISVVLTRIQKLLKQKRKLDEMVIRKPLYSRMLSILPSEMLLADNMEVYVKKAAEMMMAENSEHVLDVKIPQKKIEVYLGIFAKIPVIFCGENIQKLFILLLLGLHKDSNNEKNLQKHCESLVISVLQHSRFTLLDVFKADTLLKLLTDNFERCEEVFSCISQSTFKINNKTEITDFGSAIAFIRENIGDDRCLKYAVSAINLLTKMKKSKISIDARNSCVRYKSALCQKLAEVVERTGPEDRLIEAYVLVLKAFLTQDQNNTFSKMTACLHDYIEYCVGNLSEVNLRGCLLLFTTVLHHKTAFSHFNEDVIIRIWKAVEKVNVENDVMEEYSQLVRLVATLIPNEQFSDIFGDLLNVTEESMNKGDEKEFRKHIRTWKCIISSNFNSVKTGVLRERLECLLEKLMLALKSTKYEELLEEVIQLEVSIIQANHVPLTAVIVDFFLLTVSILATNRSDDFVDNLSSGILLLENLLTHRNPVVMDRLPPYLLQYRVLLKELALKSSSNAGLQQGQLQKVADCGHRFERLTRNLVTCSKDMSRIAMYLVVDILAQYEEDTLHPNVKKHLDNCIYSLMSLCDQHAVQYLMRVQSNASTEIFKFMYQNYKKYYRFTGKV